MASITRLNDSGIQGVAAARLAFAKPNAGGGLQAATISSTASELRVSRWTFTSAGAVTLASAQALSRPVSQSDGANVVTTVAAFRDAADGTLHVDTFDSDGVHGIVRGVIDDQRLAVVRRGFDTDWFVAFISGGDLQVDFWQLTGSGNNPLPMFVSSASAGAASHISGTFVGVNLITAVRTGGNLKLINWAIGGQNAVQRLGDSGGQGDAVDDLCVGGFSPLDNVASSFCVTAARNTGGNLEITSWRVNSSGSITKMSSHVGGAVVEVAITSFQDISAATLGVFVTATTNAAGNLVVTSWQVSSSGGIQQLATNSAGGASQIAIMDVGTDLVATTCVLSTGIERVITWRIA
jgi:hypothetical protein